MDLTFLGAAQTVTGSCHLLETGEVRIMIDCGMFQGPREIRERNYHEFPVEPSSIDYLLLTHAHIDHSGLIPKLFNHGFRGRVLATPVTVDLCGVMLPDSGYVQEMEVEQKNRRARRAGRETISPVYTAEDARHWVQYFESVEYNREFQLTPEIKMRFVEAGHILGSAMVELYVQSENGEKKLIFTGDLGGKDKPYVNDPKAITSADYLIMESTYGGRFHRDKENRIEKFKEVIQETYNKGGNLIIPAFAVERTQDLLYDINELYMAGEIPQMDVYIDSPMAVAVTEIFKKYPEYFDKETTRILDSGNNPLDMPILKLSRTTDESMALNKIKGGAIILSASGMCDAGRIKHHLKHNLWRRECTVLFVGYQAPGTKGQRLLDGVSSIRIHGEEIKVNADIRSIDGYSSHADQNALLSWLEGIKNSDTQVYLVHGSPESLQVMEDLIPDRMGLKAYAPSWKESVTLLPEPAAAPEVVSGEIMKTFASVSEKIQKFAAGAGDYEVQKKVLKRLKEIERLANEGQES